MSLTTITATNARTSECTDTNGAVDADVAYVDDHGDEHAGEVTLLPRDYDGQLDTWGSPDNWCSALLLDALRTDDPSLDCLPGEIVAAVRALVD